MVAIEADVRWHSDIVRLSITCTLTFQCTMLQATVSATDRLLRACIILLQATVLVDSTSIGSFGDMSCCT